MAARPKGRLSRQRRTATLCAVAVGAFALGIGVQRAGIPHQVKRSAVELFTGLSPDEGRVGRDGLAVSCSEALAAKGSLEVVVLGDSRGPAWREKYLLLERILAEGPDLVLHLGDMTHGAPEAFWRIFDAEEGRIIQAGIPFVPVLGNHEYSSRDYPGVTERNVLTAYHRRFPWLQGARWYAYSCGPLRVVVLDSYVDLGERSAQRAWLREQLAASDERFLIVALHHPIMTRHPGYGPAEKDLTWMIEWFQGNAPRGLRRVDAVLSGHVHNYERFAVSGVQYVVSGGGGSPPMLVPRDPADVYPQPGPTYHYLRLHVEPSRMEAEMIRYSPVKERFVVGDAFEVVREPERVAGGSAE
jgi:predicted phosphodiesterase